MSPRRRDLLAGALLVGSALAGCLAAPGGDDGGDGEGARGDGGDEPRLVASTRSRESPDVAGEDLVRLVRGNTDFALALHRNRVAAAPADNLFLSPYSGSVALAMTYAGARGTTATQMANALRFQLDGDHLHPAFNALDRALEGDDEGGTPGSQSGQTPGVAGQPFELRIVNSIWGQADYPFGEAFLDTLATSYGAGLRTLDFTSDPDAARVRINDWVADQTNDRIEDLLPEGVVTALTRLVLTDAVSFEANWRYTFPKEATEDGEFTALDGSAATVPTMHQSARIPYALVDGHQLVELPYVGGDVGMVVVLPAEGEFESFERELDPDRLGTLVDALEPAHGSLALPRFTVGSAVRLKDALSTLGMPNAFDPVAADFGGMADLASAGLNLYLQDVVQQSFVSVDEDGTEAAAATGVVAGVTSASLHPFEMTVDRPFLYFVRHRGTGTVLFLGRFVDGGAGA